MADERTYTADQVATAARELRQAAGSEDESYTAARVLDMLRGEIRLLRERGFTDQRITDLLIGFDIDVTAGDVAKV